MSTSEREYLAANRRRGELIGKEVNGEITAAEAAELEGLQAYVDGYLDSVAPRPTAVLEALESRVASLESLVAQIGDYAHDRSTGPAVEDDYWEIRRMAFDGLKVQAVASEPQWSEPFHARVYGWGKSSNAMLHILADHGAPAKGDDPT